VVNGKVLQERQQIAVDGVVTVATSVTKDGKLFSRPEMHLRGVVTSAERGMLEDRVQEVVAQVLTDRWSEFARVLPGGDAIDIDWAGLQVQMEKEVQRLLRKELQSNPLLVFLMQNPDEEGVAKLHTQMATRSKTPTVKSGPIKVGANNANNGPAKAAVSVGRESTESNTGRGGVAVAVKEAVVIKEVAVKEVAVVKAIVTPKEVAPVAEPEVPAGRRRTRSSAKA
jgi:Ribonuclease J C-terminal domain